MASEQERILTTQQERLQAEIAELKIYDQAMRSTREEIRALKREQDNLEWKGKRYTSEYLELGQKRAEQMQHLAQQWRELRANYPDIATGKSGNDRFVTPFEVRGDNYLKYEGRDAGTDAAYKVTLEQALLIREDTLRALAQQQMLSPLKDTVDTVRRTPTPPDRQPSPIPDAMLTPAEKAVLNQTRREFSAQGVTPLKDTLDDVRGPDRKSEGGEAPPPPAGWVQNLVDSTKNWWNRPEPSAQQASPRSFRELFEQPALGERQTVDDYWKQQHEQEFNRQMDQYYESQPPSQPTPAPKQPGHLKDLQPTTPQQPPPTDKPTSQQPEGGHFIDLFTQGEQLQDIAQGIEQIKAEMDREQGQPSQGKTPFRQLFEQGPEPPHQEQERDRSR